MGVIPGRSVCLFRRVASFAGLATPFSGGLTPGGGRVVVVGAGRWAGACYALGAGSAWSLVNAAASAPAHAQSFARRRIVRRA